MYYQFGQVDFVVRPLGDFEFTAVGGDAPYVPVTKTLPTCPIQVLDEKAINQIKNLAVDYANFDFYQSRPEGSSLTNSPLIPMYKNCESYPQILEIANNAYTERYNDLPNICPVNEKISAQDYAEKMQSFTSYGKSEAFDDFSQNRPRGTSLNKQKLLYSSCTKYPELLKNFSDEYNRTYDNLEESQKLGRVVGGVDASMWRPMTIEERQAVDQAVEKTGTPVAIETFATETPTTETPTTEEPKQGALGILAIGLIVLKVLAT
jgi:hypothetical protein